MASNVQCGYLLLFLIIVIPWCRLESDDSLVRVQEHKLSGTWPRGVAIRDNVMLVVDQHGDSLEVIKVDNESGLLSSTGTIVSTPPQPSFVGFME